MLSQLVETSCSSRHNGYKTRLLDQLSSYRTSVQLDRGKERDWGRRREEEEVERRMRDGRGEKREREGKGQGRRGEKSVRVS